MKDNQELTRNSSNDATLTSKWVGLHVILTSDVTTRVTLLSVNKTVMSLVIEFLKFPLIA